MSESTVKIPRKFRTSKRRCEAEINQIREYAKEHAKEHATRVYPYASYDVEKESRTDRILNIVTIVFAVILIALCVYLAILLS